MGGQQFATDAVLFDTRPLNRLLHFDEARGLAEFEAGVQWRELLAGLLRVQRGRGQVWTIRQKQTGADRLCLGGALAANVHGRGLTMKPFIDDVESFRLLDADGRLLTCSRTENPELFRLAAGGYGLFGLVYSITLRLVPRHKVRRVVEVRPLGGLVEAFADRIRAGFTYGDFQFAIDPDSPGFLREGVLSCYQPVGGDVPLTAPRRLRLDDWRRMVRLAHADPGAAFRAYADYYLQTDGQVYWSDRMQLSNYLQDYHQEVDRHLGAKTPASDIITELYVPRAGLENFMTRTAVDFRRHRVRVFYGTIRLIEPDGESFLAWARQPYACIIFNLCTRHTPEGLAGSAAAFRRLIDRAIDLGGSYYLTYHKYATREQVLACYPQFPEFLRNKLRFDPAACFRSDWWRHHTALLA